MRCSGWSSLAISISSALALAFVLAAPAAAHVVATPSFLASGSSGSISLSVPNERDQPMTELAVTVPSGLRLEHAHAVEGWEGAVDGQTATWTGGSLAGGAEATFGATIAADAEPGVVELEAEQRYATGEVVRWPVALTIVPATESPPQNLGLAAVIGVMGLLVVAALGVLTWRRRVAVEP